ncbi:MAG: hypothetical protein ACRC28_13495 [Clostridium sp.]|uniref:hypothetical protein n=1 Tax=Clostridium sp. TaxID=1506 RepID=UPI003F2ED173
MNKKRIITIIIGVIVIIAIFAIIIGVKVYDKKTEYAYINKNGNKYTEEQLATIKVNNLRIQNMEERLQSDSGRNMGSLTVQGAKDLNAVIPDVGSDSASNILGLQTQLISNLQQDLASN